MHSFEVDELKGVLRSGLLSFPVTHFRDDYSIDPAAYRAHLEMIGEFGAAAWFTPGGTGEYFSLTTEECTDILRMSVDSAPEGLPVIAGVGGGTRSAMASARSAHEDGANGILVLPPYLVESTQEGLRQHVSMICASTDLPVVLYHRANGRYDADTLCTLADRHPNLIGLKDGICDIEMLTRVRAKLGDRLVLIGGLPTAEMYAAPFQAIGVDTYSSAIFNFAPEWALEFFSLLRQQEHDELERRIRDFVVPYVEIRDRKEGYAVSIVKEAMSLVGKGAGPVRPPLVGLSPGDSEDLSLLLKVMD